MQTKIFNSIAFLALLTSALSMPNPLPDAEADAAPVSDANAADSLVARSCSYSTGCRSLNNIVTPGKYCGFCYQVEGTYVDTHIYQLSDASGASGCCDYGVATSCKNEWAANPT